MKKHTFTRSALALAVTAALPMAASAAEEPRELPVTEAAATEEQGYKVDNASSPKLTQTVAETPRTINIISGDVLEDQGVTSLNDALRNVAGVSTFGGGEGGGGVVTTADAVTIRGFDARTSTYVDGMRDIAGYSRDLFNFEQIEVVKGASGSLEGRSTGGGSVNLVTKQAKMDSFASVAAKVDTVETKRVTLDVNEVLAENVAGRANLLFTDGGDVLDNDVENYKTMAAAGSLLFEVSDKTSVTLDAMVMKQDNVPVLGLPYVTENQAGEFVPGTRTVTNDNGTPDDDSDDFDETVTSASDPNDPDAFGTGGTGLSEGPLPESMWDNYYGVKGRDYEEVDVKMITLGIKHEFNDSFSIQNRTRVATNERETVVGRPVIASTFPESGRGAPTNYGTQMVDLSRIQAVDDEYKLLVNQTDALFKLGDESFSQDIVVGVELAREQRISNFTNQYGSFSGNGFLTYTVDGVEGAAPRVGLFDPSATDIQASGGIEDTGLAEDTTAKTAALYVFDTLKFGSAFQLDVNARYESYKLEGTRCSGRGSCTEESGLEVDGGLFSYGAAATYYPTENGSVYVSYANSEEPIGVNLDLNSAEVNKLEPQEAKSVELGTKWELFEDKLLLSAALYKTKKTVLDSEGRGGASFIGGEQEAKGYELSATGQITDQLSINANYAKLKTEVIKDYTEDAEGNGLQSSPENTANLWANYTLLDGDLSLGGGATYSSGDTFWRQNRAYLEVDAHTEYWLMVGYQAMDNLNVQLNVDNITDERYVTDYSAWGHFRPNDGRVTSLSVKYDF